MVMKENYKNIDRKNEAPKRKCQTLSNIDFRSNKTAQLSKVAVGEKCIDIDNARK